MIYIALVLSITKLIAFSNFWCPFILFRVILLIRKALSILSRQTAVFITPKQAWHTFGLWLRKARNAVSFKNSLPWPMYIINSADETKLPWLKFVPSPLEQRTINFILRILNMKWSERQPQIYKQLFFLYRQNRQFYAKAIKAKPLYFLSRTVPSGAHGLLQSLAYDPHVFWDAIKAADKHQLLNSMTSSDTWVKRGLKKMSQINWLKPTFLTYHFGTLSMKKHA